MSNQFIAEHLKRTSGFQDVAPTLLASGEIGIYYCNTEKLLEDGGEFKNYGDDAGAMYQHAVATMKRNPTFEIIVKILAEKTNSLLMGGRTAISGGQTRDWLFSMPVAYMLKLSHIALYKQEDGKKDRIEVQEPNGERAERFSLEGLTALHIVDLITEGSSCLSEDEKKGWIPMLRNKGAKIYDLLAVVSRLQGGEENLARAKVKVHSKVTIDADYVKQHSANPDAVEYQKDPTAWSKAFLAKHGGRAFAKFFDPSGGKTDRAKKFMDRYGGHLKEAGKFDELNELVLKHYKIRAHAVAEGHTRYNLKEELFSSKWLEAVIEKCSHLCVGLDPAEYWSRPDNTLPEGMSKLEWSLKFIYIIAPYAAAVKINQKFVEELSGEDKKKLVDRIHANGMVAIWDAKLADIGATNDAGFYHADNFGFDAVTYSPFAGNFAEAAQQAHNRGMGLIGMDIMSNPQHRTEKNKLVDIEEDRSYHSRDVIRMRHPKLGNRRYVPQFIQLAHEAAKHKWDGVVIGAPSPANHVTMDEVKRIRAYIGDDVLVLMPGVGAQGGDAKEMAKIFGDNLIVNVGTAVMYAKDPAKEAQKYNQMLHELRGSL